MKCQVRLVPQFTRKPEATRAESVYLCTCEQPLKRAFPEQRQLTCRLLSSEIETKKVRLSSLAQRVAIPGYSRIPGRDRQFLLLPNILKHNLNSGALERTRTSLILPRRKSEERKKCPPS